MGTLNFEATGECKEQILWAYNLSQRTYQLVADDSDRKADAAGDGEGGTDIGFGGGDSVQC